MRRPLTYRSLPLWLQWALPFTVAAAVVIAVVAFVHHETNDVSSIASVSSPGAIVEQNREDRIIVEQQQAPHTAAMRPGAAPLASARSTVVAYERHQVDLGVIAGPISSARCARAGGGPSRLVLRCTVTASVVTYPFDVVVRPADETVTYCQRVAPPVPSMDIPVSGRCT